MQLDSGYSGQKLEYLILTQEGHTSTKGENYVTKSHSSQ